MNEQMPETISSYPQEISDLITSVSSLKQKEWTLEEVQVFCTEHGFPFDANVLPQSQAVINQLISFDFASVLEKLEVIKKQAVSLFENSHEWGNYNSQYQMYISGQISAMTGQMQTFKKNIEVNRKIPLRFNQYISNIYSALQQLNQKLNPNLNELFEHFKYGDKNYVIFGKNGAGKTTLLKKISSEVLKTNSYVIPATRIITIQSSNFNPDVALEQILSNHEAIQYLIMKLQSQSIRDYENGLNGIKNTKDKFIDIFNKLGLERNIYQDDYKAFLYISETANKYPLSQGSDGERTAVYMILATLLLPQNSFVFIDEPENHLNGLLMRNLFNQLEAARPDVRFIYLTHNIDFIESRSNVELIYLEKTEKYQEWKFKKIDDFQSIDLDIILSIEGSHDDIIFCEGDNQNSIDSKILTSIYTDYTIMPVGSCEKVIENTKGLNGHNSIFRRNAIGILDNDFRTDTEVEGLKIENIYTLDFNEWEDLLISSDILEKVNHALLNKDISNVKASVVEHIKEIKTDILNDFLNKRYLRIISTKRLKYDNNFENTINKINQENKTAIIKEVEDLGTKIDDLTGSDYYDSLLKIVPGKMLFGYVIQQIGLNNKDDYIAMVQKLIKKDDNFKGLIAGKIGIPLANICRRENV